MRGTTSSRAKHHSGIQTDVLLFLMQIPPPRLSGLARILASRRPQTPVIQLRLTNSGSASDLKVSQHCKLYRLPPHRRYCATPNDLSSPASVCQAAHFWTERIDAVLDFDHSAAFPHNLSGITDDQSAVNACAQYAINLRKQRFVLAGNGTEGYTCYIFYSNDNPTQQDKVCDANDLAYYVRQGF